MTAFAPIAGFPGGHFNAQCTVSQYAQTKDARGAATYGLDATESNVPCRLVPASSEQRIALFREEDRVAYMLHLPIQQADSGAALTVTGSDRFTVGGVVYQARGPGVRHQTHQEVPVTEEAS